MTLQDDRLTGDVWWCVCCGCKGDWDRWISIILLLLLSLLLGRYQKTFQWGWWHSFLLPKLHILLPRQGLLRYASLVFLLGPPPPPPPPIFSALWCQCVCHTAVKANATQAPDHISASHEHPPLLHLPSTLSSTPTAPHPHFLSSKLTRPGLGSAHLIGERRSIKEQDPKANIWCFMIQESVCFMISLLVKIVL